MKTYKELVEEINKLTTYHADEGTSGYLLNDDQINKIITLIRSHTIKEIREKMPKKKIYQMPKNLGEHWGLTESNLDRLANNGIGIGYNKAIFDIQSLLTEMEEGR